MINIKSPAFKSGSILPEKYALNGQNISPPFFIENVHPSSKSLVLVMEDLDALFGFSNHWLLWNIPAETKKISENEVPAGGVVGRNSFGENKYRGPGLRLDGEHRYLFTIYALDTFLDLPSSARRHELEEHLTNHLLDEGKILVKHIQKDSLNNFLDLI